MGIYDRDYYRDSPGFFSSWGRWSATTWIIVITGLVFVAQVLTMPKQRLGMGPVTEFGIYSYQDILDGEVWRLLTAVFLHDPKNIFHIVFNMLILYWTGRVFEERNGSSELVAFYLTAGVAANLGNFLIQVAGAPHDALVLGASGAVTAIFVWFAMNFPHQRVLLFFILPLPIWAVVVLYVVLDAAGAMGMRNDKIAFVVHLFGALFGFLYAYSGVRLTSLIPDFSRSSRAARPRAHPRLRVVPRDDEDDTPTHTLAAPPEPVSTDEPLESKLDRVLEKVSKYGQESLSGPEREILFRASEVYKKKRK